MNIVKGAKTACKASKRFLIKNGPSILTGVSVTGTVASVIFSAKATAKAVRIIDEEEKRIGHPLTFKEKFKLCWKFYILTATTTAASVGSGIASNAVNLGRIAEGTAAYAALEYANNEYRKKVVEAIGEEAEKDIRNATTEKVANEQYKESNTKVLPTGDELFYLYDTKQWFRSDIHKIRQWAIDVHEEMLKGPQLYVSTRQVFDILDNPQISCPTYLDGLGWDIDDKFGIIEEPARLDSGEIYTILYIDPPAHDSFASNNY